MAERMGEFNWEDPLGLEAQLTEEERMIRDSVQQFCADKLQPVSAPRSRKSALTAKSWMKPGPLACLAS